MDNIYKNHYNTNMKRLDREKDEQLVTLYQQGNDKAFDTLLKRYKDRVYSYILLVVKNADQAEDIFQETLIKAVLTIKQGHYKENGKFISWLIRIAHNIIIDIYRQGKNKDDIFESGIKDDLLNNIPLIDFNIEDIIINEQVLKDVRKLIDYLPENQQEVIRLHFYMNLNFREIAEITKVSINTAIGRMRYALVNLRQLAKDRNMVLELH